MTSSPARRRSWSENPVAGVHWSPRESTRVWTGWMPMAQGFWARSPRIQRHPTPLPRKNGLFGGRRRDFRPRSESRRSTIIIMRATLHDHPPNTYYGQWLAKNAGKHAAKWGAIAHNESIANLGVAPFGVTERDFPGNRSPARWKFVCRPKVKSARQAKGALTASL